MAERMARLEKDCCVRGYHVYQTVWRAAIGESLLAVAIARDGTLDAKSPLASGSPCIGLKKRRRLLICLLYYHTTCIKVIVRFLIIRIDYFSNFKFSQEEPHPKIKQ